MNIYIYIRIYYIFIYIYIYKCISYSRVYIHIVALVMPFDISKKGLKREISKKGSQTRNLSLIECPCPWRSRLHSLLCSQV